MPSRMLKTPAAAAVVVALASCTTASTAYQPSPRAAQELASELSGRTAGPPQKCIDGWPQPQMQIIDDHTLLFKDGRTIYLQQPMGGCPGLAFGGYTLVTRKFGTSQTCEGDINNLVNLSSGMQGGSCVFGPFIPYTKPAS